jgi:hypothetical protein
MQQLMETMQHREDTCSGIIRAADTELSNHRSPGMDHQDAISGDGDGV